MGMIPVTCVKGGDSKTYTLDSMAMLSAVRAQLTNDEFLPTDASGVAYRFIASQSQSTKASDAIIPESVEHVVPLAGVLDVRNQLIITNSAATIDVDLIGIGTPWFFDGYVGVQIALNTSDPAAVETNSEFHAVNPVMLTNVKTTNPEFEGMGYDNVCVCVENSVVEFTVSSWGAAGWELQIKPAAGESICEGSLFSTNGGGAMNTYSQMPLRCYASNPTKTIQIVSAASQGLTGNDKVRFQKVTIKTRRMTSYNYDGKTFASNEAPPRRTGPSARMTARVAAAVDEMSEFSNEQNLVHALDIVTVPGPRDGGPVEGPKSSQPFAPGISNMQTDDWSHPLGIVIVFFFIFESWEAAQKVIKGYNPPNPNLWN